MAPGIGRVQVHVGGLDGDLPALGHGIPGIHRQVHDHLLDLTGIGLDHAQVRPQDGHQIDVLADQAPQHLIQVHDQIIEIQDLGREDLLAAEGQELAGQGGGPFRGRLDFLHILGEDRRLQTLAARSSHSR